MCSPDFGFMYFVENMFTQRMLSTRYRFNGTKLSNIVAQTIPDSLFKYSAASSCWMTMVDSSISVGVPWISLGRNPDGGVFAQSCLNLNQLLEKSNSIRTFQTHVLLLSWDRVVSWWVFPITTIHYWTVNCRRTVSNSDHKNLSFLRYSTIKLSFLIN